ncbi:MAG: 23S rRNA (guanosine(2251)-2'-O)-methyltransferase RlmB [Flavobacteriales bacterium]
MKKQRNLLVFGLRPVTEAIQSGKTIDRLFIQDKLKGELSTALFKLLREKKIAHTRVPPSKLNRLTRKNHQGVVGFISPITFCDIEILVPSLYERGEVPLLLILDRITDTRNFGALVRTAACTGVQGIITPEKNSAPITQDAIKTSVGALFRVPIIRHPNLKVALQYLKLSGLQLIAATERADCTVYDLDWAKPTALLLGSEENGISPAYLKMSDEVGRLPMLGPIGSLNVSVACGAILYEAVRQRLR